MSHSTFLTALPARFIRENRSIFAFEMVGQIGLHVAFTLLEERVGSIPTASLSVVSSAYERRMTSSQKAAHLGVAKWLLNLNSG